MCVCVLTDSSHVTLVLLVGAIIIIVYAPNKLDSLPPHDIQLKPMRRMSDEYGIFGLLLKPVQGLLRRTIQTQLESPWAERYTGSESA